MNLVATHFLRILNSELIGSRRRWLSACRGRRASTAVAVRAASGGHLLNQQHGTEELISRLGRRQQDDWDMVEISSQP